MAQAEAQTEAEAGLSQSGRQALLCAMQIVAISAEAQLNCNEADKLPPPPEPRPPPTHTPAHTHALPRFGLQIARAEQINCYKILPKSRIQKANSVHCMCALGRVCVCVRVCEGVVPVLCLQHSFNICLVPEGATETAASLPALTVVMSSNSIQFGFSRVCLPAPAPARTLPVLLSVYFIYI